MNLKKFVLSFASLLALASVVMAEGEGFNAVTVATSAGVTVSAIVGAIQGIMGAAILLYVGFLGYRKIREGMNKV